MPKCRDCLHWEVCDEYRGAFWGHKAQYRSPRVNASADSCIFYKDRSRFVELPCKVGDTVYFDNMHIQSARVLAIYIDAEGGMLDLEITAYSDNAVGFEKFINKDYKFEDIGKHLFLKKEEAEQVLKEFES